MWVPKDVKSASQQKTSSDGQVIQSLESMPSFDEDLSSSSHHSNLTQPDNASNPNGSVEGRRSIMSQQSRERRASVRMTLPEESAEVNWVLNVFNPTVSNIQEVYDEF